jgi:predicted dehydrogenase
VLIGALNPDFIEVKAIADIRPSSVHRAFHGDWSSDGTLKARPGLMRVYGWKTEDEARKNVKVYEKSYQDLLDNDEIEAVIIALPLWIHHQAAIDAMLAGKHVLTEKLMAHNVAQCKEMARVAKETGKLLATGHQRHYSVLYDNAVDTIQRGLIGDIHHIRAQWHRGNLPGNDSWQPPLPEPLSGYEAFDEAIRDAERAKDSAAKKKLVDNHKLLYNLRAARYSLKKASGTDAQKQSELEQLYVALLNDSQVDAAGYGYQDRTLDSGYHCTPIEELIRWRLWNRTGGGLMAELGSHQLDASGIFIASQFEGRQKVNPLSVSGYGVRSLFPADRDVDDHVHCMFEYPGKGYFEDNDPKKGVVADPNKKVIVTYSSINGNGYGGYGEVVLGTKGTLILEREQDTYLFAGSADAKVKVDDNKLVDTYETGGGYAVAAASPVAGDVSRGYTEEIEHWAWCIRNGKPAETLRCHPKVAMADAVIALTSNIAMAKQERIEFDPEWFDPESDATPEGIKPRQAGDLKRSTSAAGPVA